MCVVFIATVRLTICSQCILGICYELYPPECLNARQYKG